MMKANELSTGNIIDVFGECEVVAVNADKKRVKVKRQRESGFYLIEWAPLNSYDTLPVKLLEEHLLKFGMEKANDGEHFFTGYYGQCLVYDGEDWCLKARIDEPYVISYCRYVHQIQNLFHVISKSELKFNEPKENTIIPNN